MNQDMIQELLNELGWTEDKTQVEGSILTRFIHPNTSKCVFLGKRSIRIGQTTTQSTSLTGYALSALIETLLCCSHTTRGWVQFVCRENELFKKFKPTLQK